MLVYKTGEVAAEEMIIDDIDDNTSDHSGGEEEEVSIIGEVTVPPFEKNIEPISQPMEEECICVDISDSERTASQSAEKTSFPDSNVVSIENKYDSTNKPFLSNEESLDIEQVFDSHEQNSANQVNNNQAIINNIEQSDFQNDFYNTDHFSSSCNQINYIEQLSVDQNQTSDKDQFNINQISVASVTADAEQSNDIPNQISTTDQFNINQFSIVNETYNKEESNDIQNQFSSAEQDMDIPNQIVNEDNFCENQSQITSTEQISNNQNQVSSEYVCDNSNQISTKTDMQTDGTKSEVDEVVKDEINKKAEIEAVKEDQCDIDNINEQIFESSEHAIETVQEEKIEKSGISCVVKVCTDSTEVLVDESTESCSSEVFNFPKDAPVSSVPEYIPIKERISRSQQSVSCSSKYDDDEDDQAYPSLLLQEQMELEKYGESSKSEILATPKQPSSSKIEKLESIAESPQGMETDSADLKPVPSTTTGSSKDISQRLTEQFDFLSKNSEFYENNKLYRKTMTLLKSDSPFSYGFDIEKKASRKTRTFVFKKEEEKTETKTAKAEDLECKASKESESSEKFLESWHPETYEQFSSSLQKGKYLFHLCFIINFKFYDIPSVSYE